MSERSLPFFVVNAFTSSTFGGNPAAVVPLETALNDDLLLAIAAQHNLSETAYFERQTEGTYRLRWFTPKAEVRLCGHATLATAWVIRTLEGVGRCLGNNHRARRLVQTDSRSHKPMQNKFVFTSRAVVAGCAVIGERRRRAASHGSLFFVNAKAYRNSYI